VQPLALDHELEFAGLELGLGRFAPLRRPIAAIPELYGPTAVLALGDGPFEVAIVERMVLDLDRQPSVVGIERGPARHRPGLEHPVQLQAQVVVQPGGGMLLDDEAQTVGRRDGRHAARLQRQFEVALGLVG
jgi:hypothetical protein